MGDAEGRSLGMDTGAGNEIQYEGVPRSYRDESRNGKLRETYKQKGLWLT
jgi:hypothetical protein